MYLWSFKEHRLTCYRTQIDVLYEVYKKMYNRIKENGLYIKFTNLYSSLTIDNEEYASNKLNI